MALPEGVRTIRSEGFGGDVEEAIDKYFDFYKIRLDNAEIPLEVFRHPLTLRIFCEATNPDRAREVIIDYIPSSLNPLFEKYVENAWVRISRMANLSHPYRKDEVASAIYELGLELWGAKKRAIDEARYRAAISDAARDWDGSIVNLLAQEGIIFRNPGAEPGQYEVTCTFDALGGYIIADALLKKYGDDLSFSWLGGQEAIESFGRDNAHELADDTFGSLVGLVPRRFHGRQLWKHAPDTYRTGALAWAMEIEKEFLDGETVDALQTFFREHPRERRYLFFRLQRTRGAINHPLNADLLDSFLGRLSVSDRDLTWSEWIRDSRAERLADVLDLEKRWKRDTSNRSSADRLRLKWVMWLLTSTDHELRDKATRAIYWFGRGNPENPVR